MKRIALVGCLLWLVPSLVAAPGKNAADPVAAGFPAWVVPSANGCHAGRVISASDLRHKITIIVEFDAAKAKEQMLKIAPMARFSPVPNSESFDWAHGVISRDVIVVFSNVGARNDKAIAESLSSKDRDTNSKLSNIKSNNVSIYDGVTFPGAPSNEGKLPFVYVIGPTGTEPLYKGAVDVMAVRKIIADNKSKMPEWKPFLGSVAEPQYVGKDVVKALAKGKPLDTAMAKAKKGVTSKNEEMAKESQIVYDALMQTCSDLEYHIKLEVGPAPYRAAYDLAELLRCWPKSKKRVEEWAGKLKATPEFGVLGKTYIACKKYGDDAFTCKNAGEAKKIVAELEKMRKVVAPMKESKVITVQNAALIVDMELEQVIAVIPTKVPAK